MKITYASSLKDSELIAELTRLAGRERSATVALIVHLAEFDARRLCGNGPFLDLPLLPRGASPLRGRRLQPHRGRAGGERLSGRAGDAPLGSAEPDDCPTP